MRTITLWQPWASLVAEGVKTIETRSRPYPWRQAIGETLYLHAALRPIVVQDMMRLPEIDGCQFFYDNHWYLKRSSGCRVKIQRVPFGAVLATFTLVDVVPIVNRDRGPHVVGNRVTDVTGAGPPYLWRCTSEENIEIEDQRPFGDYSPGRWALLLDNIVTLDTPIPASGKQGLWTSDAGSDLLPHEIL